MASGSVCCSRITALLEDEEEIGSPNLEPFLIANKDALAAGFALISAFVAARLPTAMTVSYEAFIASPGMEIATDTP